MCYSINQAPSGFFDWLLLWLLSLPLLCRIIAWHLLQLPAGCARIDLKSSLQVVLAKCPLIAPISSAPFGLPVVHFAGIVSLIAICRQCPIQVGSHSSSAAQLFCLAVTLRTCKVKLSVSSSKRKKSKWQQKRQEAAELTKRIIAGAER